MFTICDLYNFEFNQMGGKKTKQKKSSNEVNYRKMKLDQLRNYN